MAPSDQSNDWENTPWREFPGYFWLCLIFGWLSVANSSSDLGKGSVGV